MATRLPPGANLNHEPGQHDPPEWCYVARTPGQYRYGWNYDDLAEWADDEQNATIWWWSL